MAAQTLLMASPPDGSLERDEQSRSDKTFEVTEIILQSDMDM